MQKDKQKEGSQGIVKEDVGKPLEATRLEEETTDTQNMEANLMQATLVRGSKGQSEPEVGEALEDKKKMEEYPLRVR